MPVSDRQIELPVLPRNILFATDFSSQSAFALRYALPIAHKYGSTLYAVNVRPEPVGLPESAREGLQAIGIRLKTEIPDGLDKLKESLSGTAHEILFQRGDIWSELSKVIDAQKIDLIVAGTRGRGGVGKLLLGSVAEKIFRRASCPVLTVGPAVCGETESMVDLHEILFATDFGAASMAALSHAISLAQENDARIYILHVTPSAVTAEDEAALKDKLRKAIPQQVKLTNQPKVIVEHGLPAERILAVAEELAVDLIVLGVKRTPEQFEVSSHLPLATAYKVISQSICPVLTVRG